MVLGRHALKMWSTTQATIAMSSAEAEYYMMIQGAVRNLGLQTMLRELGLETRVVLPTDSSAAKSYSSQRGLGRMRHIDVKELWLREAVSRGKVKLVKVRGDENPADLFTKYLGKYHIGACFAKMAIEVQCSHPQLLASGRCQSRGGVNR